MAIRAVASPSRRGKEPTSPGPVPLRPGERLAEGHVRRGRDKPDGYEQSRTGRSCDADSKHRYCRRPDLQHHKFAERDFVQHDAVLGQCDEAGA
jgi:hypothetical protein